MFYYKKYLVLTFAFILILISLRLDGLEIDFPHENQFIEIKNPKRLGPNESKKLELKFHSKLKELDTRSSNVTPNK